MRVLVAGASGMLGSALCDALLARGEEVVGLSRNPDSARDTNPTVTWHAWDGTGERPPAEAIDGADAVVNLTGEPIDQRWSDEAKQRIRATRVDATRNLVQGLEAADPRPRVLISQSAVGYYGDRGQAIVDESTPPGTGFDSRLCTEWEAAARAGEDMGLRVAITRTGLVLDRRGGLLPELLLPFRLGLGGPLAGGKQFMPWVHVADVVGMIEWVLRNDEVKGVLNVAAPEPVTNKEFSKALGRALNRPAIMPVPKLALRLRLGGELAGAALQSQRVIPRRALDLGYEFRFTDVEAALRDALSSP